MNNPWAVVPLVALAMFGVAIANGLVMHAAATPPAPKMCDVGEGIERYAYWSQAFTYRLQPVPLNIR